MVGLTRCGGLTTSPLSMDAVFTGLVCEAAIDQQRALETRCPVAIGLTVTVLVAGQGTLLATG